MIFVPPKINHEETKNTKNFLFFLLVLGFFVVDYHCFSESP